MPTDQPVTPRQLVWERSLWWRSPNLLFALCCARPGCAYRSTQPTCTNVSCKSLLKPDVLLLDRSVDAKLR
jgi:hypothetical protein